jgi:hypothetical protein
MIRSAHTAYFEQVIQGVKNTIARIEKAWICTGQSQTVSNNTPAQVISACLAEIFDEPAIHTHECGTPDFADTVHAHLISKRAAGARVTTRANIAEVTFHRISW